MRQLRYRLFLRRILSTTTRHDCPSAWSASVPEKGEAHPAETLFSSPHIPSARLCVAEAPQQTWERLHQVHLSTVFVAQNCLELTAICIPATYLNFSNHKLLIATAPPRHMFYECWRHKLLLKLKQRSKQRLLSKGQHKQSMTPSQVPK